jgi:hypothetical protein
MREQNRSEHERFSGPGGLGTLFDEPDDTGRLVMVSTPLYSEQLPVSGSTVGEIRARFRTRMDIDPHSVAVLDGRDVDDETLVQPGQTLTFVRRAGQKGGCWRAEHTR